MELLDKGLYYKTLMNPKQYKPAIIMTGTIGTIMYIFMLKSSVDNIKEFLFITGFWAFVAFFPIIILIGTTIYAKKKIKEIDKKTAEFKQSRLTVQIVSKSLESILSISTNSESSRVSGTTYQQYKVGVRSITGISFTVANESLYMGTKEGEFIDIIVKQKVDKNNNVIDSSHIPLMQTIRASV